MPIMDVAAFIGEPSFPIIEPMEGIELMPGIIDIGEGSLLIICYPILIGDWNGVIILPNKLGPFCGV